MKKYIIIIGVFIIFIVLLFHQLIIAIIISRNLSLDKNTSNNEILNTKFVFIFEKHNVIIQDTKSDVRKIYFSINDDIDIKIINTMRLISIKGGAILKTHIDSIDVQSDNIKTGGWMGAFYHEEKKFYVNKDGKFSLKE